MVEVSSKLQGRAQMKRGDPPAGTAPGANKMSPRLERLAVINAQHRTKLVRVEPTDDRYRKSLKHLPSQIGFNATGPATWPMDVFTKRRLREGSIRVLGQVEHPNRDDQIRNAKSMAEHRQDQGQPQARPQEPKQAQPQQAQSSEQQSSEP